MEGQCLGQVEEKSCQSGETLTGRNRKCWSKFFYWILTPGNFRMIYFWSYISALFSQSNYNDIVDQFLPNVFKALFSVSMLTSVAEEIVPLSFPSYSQIIYFKTTLCHFLSFKYRLLNHFDGSVCCDRVNDVSMSLVSALCNFSEKVGSQRYIHVHHNIVMTSWVLFVVSSYFTSDKLLQTWDLYLRQWHCTQANFA